MKFKSLVLSTISLAFLLASILSFPAGAQDPGLPDTVYFSCGSDSSTNGDTLFIPCNGTHDVTITLNINNDEPVQGFQIPLTDECYGIPNYAYLDSAKNFALDGSFKPICYYGSRFYSFSFVGVKFDLHPPQVLPWGIGVAGIDSGNGLLATLVYTVKDTGRICLDTLPYDDRDLELVDENSVGYTPIFRADTFIIAVRTQNTYPVLTLPLDVDTALASPQNLCITGFLGNDSDLGDTIILEKMEGPGTFVPDTLTTPGTIIDSICFVPESLDSTYMFVFKLSDQCPAEVYDSFSVTVHIDWSPVLTVPDDMDTILCQTQNLCIYNITATDADTGDTLILEKIQGPGTFVPDTGLSPLTDSICFTPASSDSTYMFVFRVADSDQLSDQDTFYVTVDMDDPPDLALPAVVDTCLPPFRSLCIKHITATDPNPGDTIVLEKISGPGTFVPDTGLAPLSDSICFDPALNDSIYEFIFKVTDGCDSTHQDTFYVSVSINQPPVLTLPSDIDTLLSAPEVLCFNFQATDPDVGDTIILEKIEGPGTFVPDTAIMPGTIIDSVCFMPANVDSTYKFIFKVSDQCPSEVYDTFYVTVDINEPPILTVPSDIDTFLCALQNLCIYDIIATDADPGDTLILEKIQGPGTFIPDSGLSPLIDMICFFPAPFGTTYTFVFRVTDEVDTFDQDTFYVGVEIDEPPEITSPESSYAVPCHPYTYVTTIVDTTRPYAVIEYLNHPSWLTIVNDSITGTPDNSTVDTSFMVIADDSCWIDSQVVSIDVLLCSDVNNDSHITIADAVYLVRYLFKFGPEPIPYLLVGDVNCGGKVEISDVVYLVNYLFKSGPPPCEPEK